MSVPPYGPPQGFPPYSGPPLYQPVQPTNGLAIGAMVVSLVAAFAAFATCGVGGVLGIAGAIMGHVAKRQTRERNEQGDGFAIAGIVVGWISFAIGVVAVAVILIFVIGSFSAFNDDYQQPTTV